MPKRDFMGYMNSNTRAGVGVLTPSTGVETLVSSDSGDGTEVPAPGEEQYGTKVPAPEEEQKGVGVSIPSITKRSNGTVPKGIHFDKVPAPGEKQYGTEVSSPAQCLLQKKMPYYCSSTRQMIFKEPL
jgi:hypothetical protein